MSLPSTRLIQAAARTGVPSPRTLAPVLASPLNTRSASTASSPKKKKKGDADDTTSYAAKKALAKEQRRQTYQKRQERLANLHKRRDGSPKDVKKNEFRAWFDKYRTRNETMDRKARQAGLPWRVRVCAVVERLPVVLPDKEEWEEDFDKLKAYLQQFGKEYPKELGFTKEGPNLEAGERFDLSLEEIIEMLPEGYKPAPRETEADKTGEIKTLERKLKERVFLSIKNEGSNGAWAPFPVADVKADESLLDAVKRATSDAVGTNLQLYCPSNCPMAVDMYAYREGTRRNHFGLKTFFYRVQLDDGDVDTKAMKAEDYAWLTRDELVDRIKDQRGEVPSRLYHYLL